MGRLRTCQEADFQYVLSNKEPRPVRALARWSPVEHLQSFDSGLHSRRLLENDNSNKSFFAIAECEKQAQTLSILVQEAF